MRRNSEFAAGTLQNQIKVYSLAPRLAASRLLPSWCSTDASRALHHRVAAPSKLHLRPPLAGVEADVEQQAAGPGGGPPGRRRSKSCGMRAAEHALHGAALAVVGEHLVPAAPSHSGMTSRSDPPGARRSPAPARRRSMCRARTARGSSGELVAEMAGAASQLRRHAVDEEAGDVRSNKTKICLKVGLNDTMDVDFHPRCVVCMSSK